MKNGLKHDKYSRARGGKSKLLTLCCAKCGESLFDYQKDGPGSLKRTYLDRITNSKMFENLQLLQLNEIPQFICLNCKEHIGIPMVYKKENRLAFRLIEGKINKSVANI